jgi:hypothetical protein
VGAADAFIGRATGAAESCILQATTTSQIIHARFRTAANTMANVVRWREAFGAGQPALHQVGERGPGARIAHCERRVILLKPN